MKLKKSLILSALAIFAGLNASAGIVDLASAMSRTCPQERTFTQVLTSDAVHGGSYTWQMQQIGKVAQPAETISTASCDTKGWLPAVVPGTVLTSLVNDGVYPDPYFGDNNKLDKKLIPDLSEAGRDFYSYWYRTTLEFPSAEYANKRTWLQLDGINYHAEVWMNGKLVTTYSGMFWQEKVDVTEYIKLDKENVLAIKILPIDAPGTIMPKTWGAINEWHNGGDGIIGRNVTMLMTVGWDFTFHDGVRDRNTGIWRNIKIFTTGQVALESPFVRSELKHPSYDQSRETVSVELVSTSRSMTPLKVTVEGEIEGTGIKFSKKVALDRNEKREVVFTPEEFPQLVMDNPKLWWPVNKGPQNLYTINFTVRKGEEVLDRISSRFGIREVRAERNTPDKSKTFYINGKQIFIQGTNWIPEAMQRTDDERTYAELRYTAQTGINMLRMWGGGITESDYLYSLCDELGIMIWEEFWMTGDTQHPVDQGLYLKNMVSAIKRTRVHPSLVFYVSSNESSFTQGAPELIQALDGTRPYQHQSECDGVHDGSPYKQVNPMTYYENTASDRGSRIDGFNPEYGAPCIPTAECLKEFIAPEDLWPMNQALWDYLDGNGFDLMTTLNKQLTDEYGESSSIEEYAMKGQFVGAMNYKGIAEVWRYNKLNSGDRFTSGYLFWYHNSPQPQVQGRMWDWSLEPTAALFAMANASEPLHPQFDYLKNTVSVANDLFEDFKGYKVTAQLYDLNGRKVWYDEAVIDIPADETVCDVIKVNFPAKITSVHFLKLRLLDNKGKEVGSNFYWRSNDKYEGRKTVTGPCTSGFQDINKLPVVKLAAKCASSTDANGENVITVQLKNTGSHIAFFSRLQWIGPDGKPVRPSYYSDNFFSLTPGESKTVTINTAAADMGSGEYKLIVGGFRQKEQTFTFAY